MKKTLSTIMALAMLAWQFLCITPARAVVMSDCFVSITQGSSSTTADAVAFYRLLTNPDTSVQTIQLFAEFNHLSWNTRDVHIELWEDPGDGSGYHQTADQWWNNVTGISRAAGMQADYLRCGTATVEAKLIVTVYTPGNRSTPTSYNWVRIRKS